MRELAQQCTNRFHYEDEVSSGTEHVIDVTTPFGSPESPSLLDADQYDTKDTKER